MPELKKSDLLYYSVGGPQLLKPGFLGNETLNIPPTRNSQSSAGNRTCSSSKAEKGNYQIEFKQFSHLEDDMLKHSSVVKWMYIVVILLYCSS